MIEHDEAGRRITWAENGEACVLDYELSGSLMTITRTWVPDQFRGRGIAGRMTRFALDTARARGWKVRPVCSYARSEEHTSELQSLMRISYAVVCLKKKNHIMRVITKIDHSSHSQYIRTY